MKKSPAFPGLGFALGLLLVFLIPWAHGQPATPSGLLVKNGQKVAFFGDEMTETGAKVGGGFVQLVGSGLETLGVKIVSVPAGHGGTSREMLARLDKDVLSTKPDWVVFNSGFADVWGRSWGQGIDLPTYEKNVTSMVEQMQAAGAKVMILTPIPAEPLDNDFNPKLADTLAFLRQLAKEKNLPLADLNAAFVAYLKAQPPGSGTQVLTDSTNIPNPEGHELIAKTILQAFGASPAQVAQAEAVWLDAPGGATVSAHANFTVRHTTLSLQQYEELKKVALARKLPLFDLINEVYLDSILEALQAHGDFMKNGYPDNLSNEADPIFNRKIMELIK